MGQSPMARERFYITKVRQEKRIALTVAGQERHPSIGTLLADKFEARDISIDMFVLHRKGNHVTTSVVLDKNGESTLKQLEEIADEMKEHIGEDISILLHGSVAKLTIQGHGLCTSPRTSHEIFGKIKRAGCNIEMMSISENEIGLIFQPSVDLTRIVENLSRKANKLTEE